MILQQAPRPPLTPVESQRDDTFSTRNYGMCGSLVSNAPPKQIIKYQSNCVNPL